MISPYVKHLAVPLIALILVQCAAHRRQSSTQSMVNSAEICRLAAAVSRLDVLDTITLLAPNNALAAAQSPTDTPATRPPLRFVRHTVAHLQHQQTDTTQTRLNTIHTLDSYRSVDRSISTPANFEVVSKFGLVILVIGFSIVVACIVSGLFHKRWPL